MKKLLLTLLALPFISIVTTAQQSESFNVNNINTIVSNSLSPFFDNDIDKSNYKVSFNPEVFPLFKTGLTILAKDINDSIYVSSQGLLSSWDDDNFSYGPIATDYNISSFQQYEKVWKVTSQELWSHQQGLGTSNSISTWPAHGDTSNGEAFYLAPFVDVDGNGLYDPSNGDYPKIKGDAAVYFIINDKSSEHHSFFNQAVGVEIHVMIYGFQSHINVINNTTFVNYSIYNRSMKDFNEFYVSAYLDADIECGFNDFHGSDSLRNTIVSFEGKPTSVYPTYFCQDSLIRNSALALKFLNYNMYSSFYNGLNTFSVQSPNSISASERVYNLMQGHSVFGDTKYSFIDSSIIKQISPCGINNIVRSDTIIQYGNDAKLNSTIKFESFPVNSSLCIDLAYVYSRNESLDNIGNAIGVLLATDTVQTFYDNVNLSCIGFLTSTEEKISKKLKVTLFPNPSNQETKLSFSRELAEAEVSILNTLGQEVRRIQVLNDSQVQINRNELESGIYFYSVMEASNVIGSGKIVFE